MTRIGFSPAIELRHFYHLTLNFLSFLLLVNDLAHIVIKKGFYGIEDPGYNIRVNEFQTYLHNPIVRL